MEFLRARREKRYALVNNDPKPVDDVGAIWDSAAQVATVGIFILLLGAGLYFCRPILLPIMAALVVGTTLAPMVKGPGQALAYHPGRPSIALSWRWW